MKTATPWWKLAWTTSHVPRSLLVAIAPLLASSGCADLAPIEAATCGNGVLDPGEDCDGFVDTALGRDLACANASHSSPCRYVCDDDAPCPIGWDCGQDAVCRHSSGELVAGPSAPDWTPDTFAVLDFDADDLIDAVGAFGGRVEFQRGTQDGFAPAGVVSTPAVSGAIVAGSLDGDIFGDAAVPTEHGVVMWRGRASGTPLESAWAGVSVPGVPKFFLDPIPSDELDGASLILFVGAAADPAAAGRVVVSLFAADAAPLNAPALLGDRMMEDLVGDVVHAKLASDHETHLAFGFKGSRTIPVIVVERALIDGRFRLHPIDDAPDGLAVDTPCSDIRCTSRATGMRVADGVLAADVDGDLDVDLIASVVGPASVDAVVVVPNAGDGTFEEPYIDARFDALVAGSTRESPRWPLLASDLNGDGRADFVSPDGVFMTTLDSDGQPLGLDLTNLRDTAEPWTRARVLDIDGDDLPDVAAISEGEAFVDFLQCDQGGSTCWQHGRFRATRRHTSSARGVVMLETGRIHGLRAADAVVIERDPHGDADDVVTVFSGTPGGSPSEAIQQSTIHRVEHFAIGDGFALGASSADAFQDVMITLRDPSNDLGWAILHGGDGAQLTSPFLLPNGQVANSPRAAQARSVIFGDLSGRDEPFADLAFIGRSTYGEDLAYWAPGAEDASLSGLPRGNPLRSALGSDFGVTCATFAAGDVDHDGHDDIVVVGGRWICPDASSTIVGTGRALAGGEMHFEATEPAIDVDVGEGARTEVGDVDGDGGADLLVAAPGVLLVFHGGPAGLSSEPERLELPPGEAPRDVAIVARSEHARGPSRIAVLTSASLIVQIPGDAPRVLSVADGRSLQSADVNLDGLGDLLVVGAEGLTTYSTQVSAPLGGSP